MGVCAAATEEGGRGRAKAGGVMSVMAVLHNLAEREQKERGKNGKRDRRGRATYTGGGSAHLYS